MLANAEKKNNSMLCVGLDPEPAKFPLGMRGDPSKIFAFCSRIVEATHDLVLAFKPQIAYFAANGAEAQLELLMKYIREVAPHIPIILDAKRGDVGSTAEQYAKEAFVRYGADAVTLSPYLGFDSIAPYLEYEGKGAFLLCKTSNKGSGDLQDKRIFQDQVDPEDYSTVYQHVARMAKHEWNINGQLGLVVGATYPEQLARVREIAPRLPLLIPGVGAQGGDATAVVKAAWRQVDGVTVSPIIVNSSRAILYASPDDADFEFAARRVALETRKQLNEAKFSVTTLAR
ncbi:TPA: orotidine-5'-phosphate decarboxylase [Candidatus Nomurabacteria bacterium]|nr:orotidine-5'-phosphate decarboxylase [Candidatus Nomurabacteria bacterium]